MDISRRGFLKKGAVGVAGGSLLYVGLPSLLGGTSTAESNTTQPDRQARRPAEVALNEYSPDKHLWGFLVDTSKCIGCGRCVKACKLENGVPMEPDMNRTWVERYVFDEHGEVYVDSPNAGIDGFDAEHQNIKYKNLRIAKSFFVPKLCNQCEKPPCVRVCPVAATYKTKDGVVLIDRDACIGCRYCVQACPYSARYFLRPKGIVDKCTWCYHRISKGLLPACVEVCPVGARKFGDLRDSESAVSKAIREGRYSVLKADLGTKPKVFYLELDGEVR